MSSLSVSLQSLGLGWIILGEDFLSVLDGLCDRFPATHDAYSTDTPMNDRGASQFPNRCNSRNGKPICALVAMHVYSSKAELPPGENTFSLGIKGKCPRCGKGKLFAGWLRMAPRCNVCGLDYSFADPADGPAFFAQWAGCIPAMVFAVWLEVRYEPPLWVHVVTTLPLVVVPCLVLLRPIKGWLVCSQYLHKAEEGRLTYPSD
jgi:uncharacterized protein (DUF983 family)